jgi:hypothetical protein
MKAGNDTWNRAAEIVKVEMDGVTRDEQHGVHLQELNGVGKMAWNGYVELKRESRASRKHVNMSEEEKPSASRPQEAIVRERERNRLNMRKIRAPL